MRCIVFWNRVARLVRILLLLVVSKWVVGSTCVTALRGSVDEGQPPKDCFHSWSGRYHGLSGLAMPLRKLSPAFNTTALNSHVETQTQPLKEIIQKTVLRKKSSYEPPRDPPSGVLLRKISSAPISPVAPEGKEQNRESNGDLEGEEDDEEENVRIREVRVKQPTIISPGPQKLAGMQAQAVPVSFRYHSVPRSRQMTPLYRPDSIASMNSFDSGYSRYPSRSGSWKQQRRQQRKSLVSNSMRGRSGIRPTPSQDFESLYSRDQDTELVYVDDRLTTPDTFPLYLAQAEIDDDLHNPDPAVERIVRQRTSIWTGFRWNRKGMRTVCCLSIIVVGLLCLVVVLPVVKQIQKKRREESIAGSTQGEELTDYDYPIMKAVRTSMVDPDTPQSAYTRQSIDGKTMRLVFSDEFSVEGRSFYEHDDQFWQAQDIHYA